MNTFEKTSWLFQTQLNTHALYLLKCFSERLLLNQDIVGYSSFRKKVAVQEICASVHYNQNITYSKENVEFVKKFC